ncbi:hypothetical protein G9A89_006066 [Geosiphon pyriformis]|nr:hypothetical protein G9A89_006066 [Geosiphon pyriformis]
MNATPKIFATVETQQQTGLGVHLLVESVWLILQQHELINAKNYETSTSCIISLDNFPPLRYFSSIVIENSENGSAKLLLFGGRRSTDFSLVKSINEENGPINRTHIPSIVDNKGRMYIWGGMVNLTAYFDKKMYIFDSSINAWSQNNPIDAPETRLGYSATLLQDSKIVIIGGWDNNATYVDINSILIYDINNSQSSSPWRTITAKGLSGIQNRGAHSAILDGYRIIIYGGISLVPLNPANALIILDTRTFTWSQPLTINPPILIPGHHSATLFKNLMIVAFGQYNKDMKGSNSLWILDISKDPFTWVTSYNSSDTNPISNSTPTDTDTAPVQTQPTQQTSKFLSTKYIVIGLVVIGVAIGIVVAFIMLRRRRRSHVNLRTDLINGHGHSTQVINREAKERFI